MDSLKKILLEGQESRLALAARLRFCKLCAEDHGTFALLEKFIPRVAN